MSVDLLARGLAAQAAAQPGIALIGIGQSNVQSAYPVLTYTPTALAGAGGAQGVTVDAGWSLRAGETVWARLTGAVPAAYNDGDWTPYTVGAGAPSPVLTRAGGASGAMTTPGTLSVDMRRSYPQAWVSATDPSQTAPFPPKDYPQAFRWNRVDENGSLLVALRDRLAALSGRRVVAADCAVGSSSLIGHWVGFVGGWNANTRYRSRRAPIAGDPRDRGHRGDVISTYAQVGGGYTWLLMECTAGGDQLYATNAASQWEIPGTATVQLGSPGNLLTVAGGRSGASAPAWNGVTARGQTVADGALTWTCVGYDYPNAPDSAQHYPYADYRNQSALRGRIGFDPFGLIQRAMEVAGDARRAGLVPVVCLVGHETDLSSAAGANSWFADALQQVADALTPRRIAFAPSMTFFNAVSGDPAWFATLSGAVKGFLAANAGNPWVLAHSLDLYDAFGQAPGANGLHPQRDDTHPGEDIHQSALTATLAGAAMADAIWPDLAGLIG